MMRKLVPKKPDIQYSLSRAAGIWSLGYIYENDAPAELVKQIEDRLKDTDSMMPEDSPLRDICAIALGRMRAEDKMATLEQYGALSGGTGSACRWAIALIKDEPFLMDQDSTVEHVEWFITPLR